MACGILFVGIMPCGIFNCGVMPCGFLDRDFVPDSLSHLVQAAVITLTWDVVQI